MLTRIYPALLLAVSGLIHCYVAWLFLVEPQEWFSRLGVAPGSALGMTEMRAVYVGFMAGFGLFQLLCAWRSAYREAGIAALVFSYAGLVAARTWGIVVEQAFNTLLLQIYVGEWLLLALSLVAFLKHQRD